MLENSQEIVQEESTGLAEAIESAEETKNDTQETEVIDGIDADEVHEEAKEDKSADKVKKFKRVVKSLDKKNRLLQEQLLQQQQLLQMMQAGQMQQQQSVYSNPYIAPTTQQFDPYTGIPIQQQPDMYELAKKAAEEQLLKKEEERKTNEFLATEENLRNKYDDYDDFTDEAKPFLTKEMLLALRELSSDSLENLYKAWNDNPDKVRAIHRLPPFKQALAVAKLDAEYSLKQSAPAPQYPSKKVIPPIKPAGVIRSKSIDDDYAAMVRKMK